MKKEELIIEEKETIIFGEKVKIKSIKMDESITRCNKHIESSIKDNRKVLKLSLEEAGKDIIGNR